MALAEFLQCSILLLQALDFFRCAIGDFVEVPDSAHDRALEVVENLGRRIDVTQLVNQLLLHVRYPSRFRRNVVG